jgi:uncharacterized YigZ family protein
LEGEEMKQYKTIMDFGQDEFIVKKSTFIGYSKPVESEEEAVAFVDSIKTKHKDAAHNCYGYIIGTDLNIQRYSDDGEPSGTAGIPILEVIRKEGLTNTAVVVTRYYGGIMLGAGGLVRAYTQGAKIGLEAGTIIERIPYQNLSVSFDYSLVGRFQNELLNRGYIIKSLDYQDKVTARLIVLPSQKDSLAALINDITRGQEDIIEGLVQYISVKDGQPII